MIWLSIELSPLKKSLWHWDPTIETFLAIIFLFFHQFIILLRLSSTHAPVELLSSKNPKHRLWRPKTVFLYHYKICKNLRPIFRSKSQTVPNTCSVTLFESKVNPIGNGTKCYKILVRQTVNRSFQSVLHLNTLNFWYFNINRMPNFVQCMQALCM